MRTKVRVLLIEVERQLEITQKAQEYNHGFANSEMITAK